MPFNTPRKIYTTEDEKVNRHTNKRRQISKDNLIAKENYRKNNKNPKDSIQFTVIGNITTNEFIYCSSLVKQLHKYRQRKFKAPKIRGVTSLEWPIVWQNLKLQFGGQTHCLQSEVAILIDDKFFGGINQLMEYVESRYHYDLRIDFQKERIQQFTDYINNNDRPFVYMHICINGDPIGTLIFMLYKDIVPKTCENFIRLCETTKGGYSGTPIHRIVKDYWIQCGGYNLKRNNDLMCENFIIPHDRRGVLCMANNGRDNDCSTQFFVLLQPAPWMDQKYVAFGQLVEGEGTLRKLENVPTWYEAPNDEIKIFKTGLLSCRSTAMPINKNTKEYLSGHVEDLNTIGEIFYEELMVKLFLTIDNIMNVKKKALENLNDVRRTKSFMVTTENGDKNLSNTDKDVISNASRSDESVEDNQDDLKEYGATSLSELTSYEKSNNNFYIPLTDVPDPEETSSNYNLQKLLKGDYCLHNDLVKHKTKEKTKEELHTPEDFCYALLKDHQTTDNEDQSEYFLTMNDEEHIKEYIKRKTDRVSFAGPVIRKIANFGKKRETLDDVKGKEAKLAHISDEELRQIRMAGKYKTGAEIMNKSASSHSSHQSSAPEFGEPHDSSSLTKFDVAARDCESNEMTLNVFRQSLLSSNGCKNNGVKDENYYLPKKASFKAVYSKSCVASESQFKIRTKRPSMTVDEYQKKNMLYAADLNKTKSAKVDTVKG